MQKPKDSSGKPLQEDSNTEDNMEHTRKKPAAPHINIQTYVNAFNQMPGLMYLLDNNCVLIDCNTNLIKLLELETIDTESVGALYKVFAKRRLWNEQQIQLIKQNDIDAIIAGQTNTNETELPVFDSNGDINYFKFTRIPLFNNENTVLGLLVILQNITKQKHMEEQLDSIKKELQHYNAKEITTTSQEPKTSHLQYSPKILLIEDNNLAQQAAKSILMSCDCLVDVVDNELHFDDIFKPGKYDLVFMDIGLENTSGYTLAKQLRKKEQGSGHKVPIIALTGFDPELVSLDCSYYQMEGAIGKPLKVEQVRQILQKYINHIDIEVVGLK